MFSNLLSFEIREIVQLPSKNVLSNANKAKSPRALRTDNPLKKLFVIIFRTIDRERFYGS